MEDSSQGSRRSRIPPRPESSASSMTRLTPSSSNSSTTNLPRNTGARGTGNSLLQERLRERKVESARHSRRRSIDMASNRDIQSSPVKGSLRDDMRPSSCGISNKPMGVKQIEDQVSTLHKQNFDLKLELYHRRQRQEELEGKLAARDAEYAELQDVNDQLLAELEKRDNAVNEAVQVICELEEKVERYERNREDVKAFDASTYEPSYFDNSHNDGPPSSPPQYEKGLLRPTRSVPRMPSFLSETTQTTENLRSLYLPNESYSDAGLPQLQEELSDGANSPRLSVLSESSFVSVYGQKQKQLPLQDLEDESPRRHRASSSVEKWVDERPIPTITPPARPLPAARKSQFLSINDVLESPLQRLEKLKHTLEKTNRGAQALERNPSVQEKRKSKELRKVFTDQGSFEQQQTLPPTPDTISTNTLRHYQNSNDTLAQDRMKEGTFLNSINAFPTPGETYNAFQSTISGRPRSAGETVTSRREGHGWDTPSEVTADLASVSSNGTYSANPIRAPRVMTPDLFSFSSKEWGRDMMYNNEPELPEHTRARYQELRRAANINSDPLSESKRSSRYEEIPYGTVPIDTTPKPEVSDRRSSLSATTKLRKSNNNSIHSASTGSTQPVVTPSPSVAAPAHKNRFSSLGLFRRSETSPAAASPTAPFPPQSRSRPARAQSYLDSNNLDDEEARATPPPIKRSRPGQTQSYRPSSAGAGMPRKMTGTLDHIHMQEEHVQGRARRGSLNAGPPTVAVNLGGAEEEGKTGGGGGKKWFGLGRSGSQRR